jgi:carbamate kinase
MCLLTSTLVNKDDRAFDHPTKPIGVLYNKYDALAAMSRYGWAMAPDPPGWRRVVPSPAPVDVAHLAAVQVLLDAGYTVVCGGGGGVPVVIDDNDGLTGVEAVVDKDHVAAILAIRLNAAQLVILTDVDGIQTERGTNHPATLRRATPEDLARLDLEPGSMGAKAEAASRFAEATGRAATIGNLDKATAVVNGSSGTEVRAAAATPERSRQLSPRRIARGGS